MQPEFINRPDFQAPVADMPQPLNRNERLMDILSCPICFNTYDTDERVPLCLRCGHTVCGTCAEALIGRSSNKKCPFDKTGLFYLDVRDLSKNYSLLDLLETTKQGKSNVAPDERLCERHPRKKVKFFCQTHSAFVCSTCLTEEHMGHDVVPARPLILKAFLDG